MFAPHMWLWASPASHREGGEAELINLLKLGIILSWLAKPVPHSSLLRNQNKLRYEWFT